MCNTQSLIKKSASRGITVERGMLTREELINRSQKEYAQLVSEINGVRWINDSIATAPERVIAALDAVPGKIVLLLGGRDKNLPWSELAAVLHNRKPKVVLFGESGSLIRKALEKFENDHLSYPIHQVSAFSKAIDKARDIAKSDDQILLSPGGTSYDEFTDFEERGNLFRKMVKEME